MSLVLLKSEQVVESLVEQATRVVMNAVVTGRVPDFPQSSWAEADCYFRTTYLPQKLSIDGRNLLQPFLTIPDNWHTIRDLIPELTNPWDQRFVINTLAYLESWRRFNAPPPPSATLFVL